MIFGTDGLVLRAGSAGDAGPKRKNLNGKRCPATAGMFRLGVLDDEGVLHQRFLVIERHLVEEGEALGVNEYLDAAELENVVARARFALELDGVGQPVAASAAHAQAQAANVGLLLDHLANSLDGALGQLNHVEPSLAEASLRTGLYR